MKDFEVPDMKVNMLAEVGIINNSNNELAIISRIPKVEEAAGLEDE